MLWFEVLKISETSDIKKIRKAYSALLKICSPEKDPEAFQNIRIAYEEGTKKAKECKKIIAVPEKVINPVDEFMKEFEENYYCYEKRINLDTWKRLLNRDVCYNIETANIISKKIFGFIMENYYIPSNIYSMFNDYFSWESNRKELCENFNEDVVTYIFNQIKTGDIFSYEYLLGVEDRKADIFIKEYKEACSLIREDNLEAAEVSLEIAYNINPNHPDLLVVIGWYLSKREDFKTANKILSKCITDNESYAKAYAYRGLCLYRIDEIEDAINDFEKAYELDSKMYSALYWSALANLISGVYGKALINLEKLKEVEYEREAIETLNITAYTEFLMFLREEGLFNTKKDSGVSYKALALYETGEYKECLKYILKVFDTGTVTTELYYIYCRALIALGKIVDVIELSTKLLKKCSEDYKLYYVKGDALQALGRFEESIVEYKKAIELNKNIPDIYNNMATSFYKIGNIKETIKYSQLAIDLNKFNGNYHANKMKAYVALEDYDEALYIGQEALELDSTCLSLYKIKMSILIKAEYTNEAMQVYENALSLGIKPEELKNERISCLLLLGNIDEAIKEDAKLRKKDPKFNFEIGITYFNNDDYINAIKYFQKARKYDKYFRDAYIYELTSYDLINKKRNAIAICEKAIKMNLKDIFRFYYIEARLIAEEYSNRDGIQYITKAIELKPDFARSYLQRASLNINLKKFHDAISDLKTSLELDNTDIEVYSALLFSYDALGKRAEIIKLCEYIENNNIDVDIQSYK